MWVIVAFHLLILRFSLAFVLLWFYLVFFLQGTFISVFSTIKVFSVQKPIRQGVVGPTLMVEELGRRKVNNGVKYLYLWN